MTHGGRGSCVVERIRHGGKGRMRIFREVKMDKWPGFVPLLMGGPVVGRVMCNMDQEVCGCTAC